MDMQKAAKITDHNWSIVKLQAKEAGWKVIDENTLEIREFNCLTDADIVGTIMLRDGSIWTNLRDHDGIGEMIYHCATVDYHSEDNDGNRTYETHFVFQEMVIAFLDYVHEHKKKYEDGLASQPGHAEMLAWLKS